jgi:hypothetical protein
MPLRDHLIWPASPKYFDLLPDFNPGRIVRGQVKMTRLFSLTLEAAFVALTLMFCLTGGAAAQVKPADPGLLPELSLYAGSNTNYTSNIE